MSRTTIARPETIELNITGLKITGIRHRQKDQECHTRLLCVHGWLDNANSFIPLMPYLPNVDLVAIDLPGHGYSDHLTGGYAISEMIFWVAAVAHTLGWQQYHLLGHSLGGAIAPMVTVADADAVQSLIMIESTGAVTEEADQYSLRLQRALQDRLAAKKFASRLFDTKQQAVDARLRAAKIEPAAARLIIDRQLRKFSDGWRWQFDPTLRMASTFYLSEDHVRNVLFNVTCPTLCIIASDGYVTERQDSTERLQQIKNLQIANLKGRHHLHMDTPEPIAGTINRFLGTTPALGG